MRMSNRRMMQRHRQAAQASSQRGSAIVIVTSLIAIMFVACVGFTIMMRTERAASANYRHMVGARQMLSSGLSQALSDIDCTMTNSPGGNVWYPPWYGQTNAIWYYATNRINTSINSPLWYDGVIYSIDPTVKTGTPAHILSTAAMQYVPKNLQKAVEQSKPEWITVSANNQIVGRYAYIAMDVSGLLDANYVSGASRGYGATPAEIQLAPSNAPLIDVSGSLAADRNTQVRFESLPELAAAPSINSNLLCNFETFSYAPLDYAPDGYPKLNISLLTSANLQTTAPGTGGLTVSNRLYSILINPSMLKLGFTAGSAQLQAFVNRFIASLIDFTSAHNPDYPLGYNTAGAIPAYPKVKPLPMIQSMYWIPAMTYTSWITNNNPYGDIPADTNFYVFGSFKTMNAFMVGVYCPKASDASAANFTPTTYQAAIQYGLTNSQPSFSAGLAVQGSATVSAGLQGKITSLLPLQTAACSNLTLSPFGAYTYSPLGFAFLAGTTPVAGWAFTNCTNTNNPLQLSVGKNIANVRYSAAYPLTTNNLTNGYCAYSVYMRAKLTRSDGKILDQVPGDWTSPGPGVQIDCTNVFLTNSAVSFNSTLFTSSNNLCAFWAEALDPRFNWDTSSTTYFGVPQWVSENTMRNATNPASPTYIWSGATNAGILPGQPFLLGWGAGLSLKSWNPNANYSEPILMHQIFKNAASMLKSNTTSCLPLILDNAGWRSNRVSGAVPYSDYTLCGRPPNTVFSRNGPLQSVGDLGYIPISYWYSLRLYDHQDLNTVFGLNKMVPGIGGTNYFPVYDWFTANTNTPPYIQRGLVNINASYDSGIETPVGPVGPGSLYAALGNMPVSDYVTNSISVLTGQPLTNVVEFIGGLLSSVTYTNPLTSVTQLGALPWFTNTLALGTGGSFSNEYDRVSVIRNAASLFTTRQQIFTIIVRAEGFASTFGYTDAAHGHTLGSAEAVFQVWRDPKPDANGNHPCFIRLYKILSQ